MSLESLLISNISAVVVTGGFLWYLVRKDKSNKDTYDRFSQIIENHLEHSNKVILSSTKADIEIAKSLQRMCDLLKELAKK